ncbi:PD-(D/E)XK nuclease family protein [Prevotella herbatica]|uniref:PD-(D/E)XK nuclease family protein n=1 Tax=Prevotella herbatica TaxID=2801997 RepID=A0ABM7P1E6_9BACT|nr:PD-(D/E)XK nuclease family protein [Prevotella herbatica]BCS86605.1 PD-(D/E)XK nuclease family protein [Prevotella herbatica]
MRTFLHFVAEDIIKKYGTNLSRIAVVFPNKRAALFLNEELARLVDKPIWSPTYITISDLFRNHSDKTVGEQIKLICDLHKTYNECTGMNETLDMFYGWGQLMLADFDDIDKNMADSQKVFANLKDIHEFDDLSYLTDSQKDILKQFFSNFSEEQDSEIKRKFLTLWSNFDNIYSSYKKRLAAQNIAYEGALYREVVETENLDFKYDNYLFVGFNMMQKVEQEMCSRLMKQGRAKFYWDFDDYFMKARGVVNHEAGTYIRQYLKYFPNELDISNSDIYHNLDGKKDIKYLSATTENIQARYISKWLTDNDRYKDGKLTAIVLADEKLLQTVIHCIPSEVDNVNITTGYPLQQSPVSSFVKMLISLRTMGYRSDIGKYRMKWVETLLRHPYIKYVSDKAQNILDDYKQLRTFYQSSADLSKDEGLSLIFKEDNLNILSLNIWLTEVLQLVGNNFSQENESDPLMQESLFRMYTLLNRLGDLIKSGDLEADIKTYTKLINQLISTTSIPFHGEPVVGIQIMGVLETRNLDFDHVLVLSCNEGNMPKGVNDSSFIPYSIRKAYGLTTIDNKVAIYSYYFHSLLQRATDITLMYNKSTSNTNTGEMSRFMMQLMVEGNHDIQKVNVNANQNPLTPKKEAIIKDEKVMTVIRSIEKMSPTAFSVYLRCQLQYYYRYIAGIKQPDNEDDEIDNRIFGNIFHKAAELFYQKYINSSVVHQSDLEDDVKNEALLSRIIDAAFKDELFKIPKNIRIDYNGLQIINRQVILDYLKQMIRIDIKLAPFSILGLEKTVSMNLTVNVDNEQKTIRLYGNIDRIDEIDEGGNNRIRIIDYKTGNNNRAIVNSIDDIFDPSKIGNHTSYFLQSMLYALIIRDDKNINPENIRVSPALLFIQHSLAKDYDPTLLLNKEKIMDIAQFKDDFIAGLKQLAEEILDSSKPFLPTEDKSRCETCIYKSICG